MHGLKKARRRAEPSLRYLTLAIPSFRPLFDPAISGRELSSDFALSLGSFTYTSMLDSAASYPRRGSRMSVAQAQMVSASLPVFGTMFGSNNQ